MEVIDGKIAEAMEESVRLIRVALNIQGNVQRLELKKSGKMHFLAFSF